MYSVGSARFPRTDGMASFRHTKKLRRHTYAKRRLRAGPANKFTRPISITQIAPGELQKHIFQVGRSMQIAKLASILECGERPFFIAKIAKHRLADALDALADRSPALLRPPPSGIAIDFNHGRLDIACDQL